MELIQTTEAKKWLMQFKGGDSLRAKSLINFIKLVSLSKFESGLISQIEYIGRLSKGKTALFPIKKADSTENNDDKPKREQHGSEGRIAHILTNQERKFPRKYITTPTVESMRAEKVTDIILVDDIIGSGKRLNTSWKYSISKELKEQRTVTSWLSYKKIKLWVVAYASSYSGVDNILSTIRPLSEERIRTFLELPAKPKWWNDGFEEMCLEYGKLTNKPGASLGYGKMRCILIFQHGCPNNCPSILWANGKHWNGLFPNRAIPNSLFGCFENPTTNVGVETLFTAGQEQLSINMLDNLETRYQTTEYLNVIVILGLINKKVKYKNISNYTSLDKDEIKKEIDKCISSGLIKKIGFLGQEIKLTDLGNEILHRYRLIKKNSIEKEKVINTGVDTTYVPSQIFGCQRKFSGFPDVEQSRQGSVRDTESVFQW